MFIGHPGGESHGRKKAWEKTARVGMPIKLGSTVLQCLCRWLPLLQDRQHLIILLGILLCVQGCANSREEAEQYNPLLGEKLSLLPDNRADKRQS